MHYDEVIKRWGLKQLIEAGRVKSDNTDWQSVTVDEELETGGGCDGYHGTYDTCMCEAPYANMIIAYPPGRISMTTSAGSIGDILREILAIADGT